MVVINPVLMIYFPLLQGLGQLVKCFYFAFLAYFVNLLIHSHVVCLFLDIAYHTESDRQILAFNL